MAEQDPAGEGAREGWRRYGDAEMPAPPLLGSRLAAEIILHGSEDDISTVLFTIGALLINGKPATPEMARALIGTEIGVDVPGAGRRPAIAAWENNDRLGCRLLEPLARDARAFRASISERLEGHATGLPTIAASGVRVTADRLADLQLSIIEHERRHADLAYLKFACFAVALSICAVIYALLSRFVI